MKYKHAILTRVGEQVFVEDEYAPGTIHANFSSFDLGKQWVNLGFPPVENLLYAVVERDNPSMGAGAFLTEHEALESVGNNKKLFKLRLWDAPNLRRQLIGIGIRSTVDEAASILPDTGERLPPVRSYCNGAEDCEGGWCAFCKNGHQSEIHIAVCDICGEHKPQGDPDGHDYSEVFV